MLDYIICMNQKEDRFQNYISDIEPETTCKAFLEKGKKKIGRN